MSEYILKIKSIADNLIAIGETISPQDQVLYVLGGLGADYNSLVTSVTTRGDFPSIDELYSQLMTFENRLEQQRSADDNSVIQANYANSNNQNKKGKPKFNNNYNNQAPQFNNNNHSHLNSGNNWSSSPQFNPGRGRGGGRGILSVPNSYNNSGR